MRHWIPILASLAAFSTACPSAYQSTYNRELGNLQEQERVRDMEAQTQRAEAQQYVAVVYFDVDSYVISEDGYRELTWFAEKVRGFPDAYIDVKGYADATGGEGHNQTLSERRSRNVADFLVTQGFDPSHIGIVGFSENFPEESNQTPKGRSRNRRVVVRVR